MRFRVFLILPLVLTLVAGGATLVAPPAAASIGIGVTPSLLKLSAKPGGTGRQELTVSNEGDEPFDATTAVVPLEGATGADSAVNWLTVEPATLHLEPKEKQTVTVSIAVPDDLESGGYYASVTITTGATTPEGNAAAVAGQLGVPFLFTIEGKGKLRQQAKVERFAPVFEPDGRVGFRALVRSAGNVYIETQGKVEIADGGGKKIASLDFPASGRILPDAVRLLTAQGSVPLKEGEKYRATVTLTFGEKGKPLTTKETFTVERPELSITSLGVCENLDRGPTISLAGQNKSDLGVQPTVTLAVQKADGGQVGEMKVPAGPLLWPDDTTNFQVDFSQRLVSGEYVLKATVEASQVTAVTRELPFQIGGIGGTPVPLCSETAPAGTPAA
jgi:hypothetical protein